MRKDEAAVTVISGDGEEHECRVVDFFEFSDMDYVILSVLETEGVLVMRVGKTENGLEFTIIESDEEFEQVSEHLKSATALGL